MKRLERYPVMMGFIGVIIGSMLVGIFQYQLYSSQRKDIRIAKKEQVLENMYSAYARISHAKSLQDKVIEAPNEEVAYQRLYEFKKDREPIIADIYANLLSVNKMSHLYFGKETRMKIDSVFSPDNHKDGWWNISNDNLNVITQTMAKELEQDIN